MPLEQRHIVRNQASSRGTFSSHEDRLSKNVVRLLALRLPNETPKGHHNVLRRPQATLVSSPVYSPSTSESSIFLNTQIGSGS